jgi:hypothetical protein
MYNKIYSKVMVKNNMTKIFRVVNDVDDKTFLGHTTQSLSARLGSFKRECGLEQYTSEIHQHFKKIGPEHFSFELIETIDSIDKDVVTKRMRELETNNKPDALQELKQQLESLVRRVEILEAQKELTENETLGQDVKPQRKDIPSMHNVRIQTLIIN